MNRINIILRILIINVIQCYGVDELIIFNNTYPAGVIACEVATDGLCDIRCYGSYSCQGAKMVCNNANTCNLLCRGSGTCQDIIFEYLFETTATTNILCDGFMACSNAKFTLNDISNVNIECRGQSSCNSADFIFEANTLTSDINNIICSDWGSCGGATFQADLVDEIYFQCNGDNSCSYTEINAKYVNILDINCRERESCGWMDVNCLGNKQDCTLNCNGDRSCTHAAILCPVELEQCHIGCVGGESCDDTRIGIVEYDYLWDLDLNCNSNISKNACGNSTFECWVDSGSFDVDVSFWGQYEYKSERLLVDIRYLPQFKAQRLLGFDVLEYRLSGSSKFEYDYANSWWDCGAVVGGHGCCPYYIQGGDYGCVAGSDCSVHCNDQYGCAYHTINGEVADALHVFCYDDIYGESCKNALIICPNQAQSGRICQVDCFGSNSCENVKIYGGNVDVLKVTCQANHNNTCYHTNVYGDGIPLIQVIGTVAPLHSDIFYPMMFFNVFGNTANQIDFVLNIPEAAGIHIYGMHASISYRTNSSNTAVIIHADYSPTISIEAVDLHSLALYADHAADIVYTIYENFGDTVTWNPNALDLHLPEASTHFYIDVIDGAIPSLYLYSLNGISDYVFTICEEWYYYSFWLTARCGQFRNATSHMSHPNVCQAESGNCCDVVPPINIFEYIQCIPTANPTFNPTYNPTNIPTIIPTNNPTQTSNNPTNNPTNTPTHTPTITPTRNPTKTPVIDTTMNIMTTMTTMLSHNATETTHSVQGGDAYQLNVFVVLCVVLFVIFSGF